MPTTFILNDETIKNSHGFYLLNSGGRFERFNVNPVMLDGHKLDCLCGRWKNLRIEGSQLLADSEFDEATELGAERAGQVERGFLKGVSIGLEILKAEWRGENLYVTEWEMFESSVTPLPSNAGAINLCIYTANGDKIKEGDVKMHIESIVRLCAEKSKQSIIHNNMENSKITLSVQALTILGLANSDDSAAVSAAIVALSVDRDKYSVEIDEIKNKQAEALVDLAVKEGKITADKKDAFVKLAKADFETTKATLDGISTKANLSGKVKPINASGGIPAERKGWTLLTWLKQDAAELNRIRTEEPELYEQIKSNSKN